jgi:hypothetical protein
MTKFVWLRSLRVSQPTLGATAPRTIANRDRAQVVTSVRRSSRPNAE